MWPGPSEGVDTLSDNQIWPLGKTQERKGRQANKAVVLDGLLFSSKLQRAAAGTHPRTQSCFSHPHAVP